MTKQQALAEYENLGAQIQLMTLRRQKLRRTILGQEADAPETDEGYPERKLELGGGGGSSGHGGHGGQRARTVYLRTGRVSKEQVLRWMDGHEEVTSDMVMRQFDITRGAAYQHLKALLDDRHIKKVAKGKYTVT